MDAMPVTLGQELCAWAAQVDSTTTYDAWGYDRMTPWGCDDCRRAVQR